MTALLIAAGCLFLLGFAAFAYGMKDSRQTVKSAKARKK